VVRIAWYPFLSRAEITSPARIELQKKIIDFEADFFQRKTGVLCDRPE
jgi:hypothetical protein